MIPVALISVLMLAQPTDGQGAVPAMDAQIARSRIAEVIGDATDPAQRIETLADVVERCEDLELVSVAQYNLGTTLIDLAQAEPERLDEAIAYFRDADRTAASSELKSKARFNLGHAYYQNAHRAADDSSQGQPGDLEGMVESLEAQLARLKEAAGAFRSVMEVDPGNVQAQGNVERVRREIKELQDQIEALEQMIEQQKEQQRQEQQQKQELADQLDELAKEQQAQAEETASNPPENAQEQEQQRQAQQELSDKTDSASEEVSQQQGAQEVLEQLKEAQEAQQRAQEAMEAGDQEQAAKEQEKAAKALQEAAQRMQELADQGEEKGEQGDESEQGQQGDKQGDEQSQEGEPEDQAEEEQGDEISEIAKELLDKERRERERRQAYRATGRPIKVEKDW